MWINCELIFRSFYLNNELTHALRSKTWKTSKIKGRTRDLTRYHKPWFVENSASVSITELFWWSGGLESTCQCRGHGFHPWSGRIPHAMGQLSLCTLRAHALRLEKSPQWEACTLQLADSSHLPQLEKAQAQQWRSIAVKNTEIKIKKKKNNLAHLKKQKTKGIIDRAQVIQQQSKPLMWKNEWNGKMN